MRIDGRYKAYFLIATILFSTATVIFAVLSIIFPDNWVARILTQLSLSIVMLLNGMIVIAKKVQKPLAYFCFSVAAFIFLIAIYTFLIMFFGKV